MNANKPNALDDLALTTSPDTGTLVCAGGEVKTLDDAGRLGGRLVEFGDPNTADRTRWRDYFTPSTDFGIDDFPCKSRVLWYHGIDREVGAARLGTATLGRDDQGITIEAQLNMDLPFVKSVVWPRAKQGGLGWSSGSVLRLIQRQPVGYAHEVKSWPIVEASLTPTPANPRLVAHEIKSLVDYVAEEAKGEDGYDPVMYARMGAFARLADALCMRVASLAAEGDGGEGSSSSSARSAAIASAFDDTRDVALRIMEALSASDSASAKSLFDIAAAGFYSGLRLGDHLDAARAAVSSVSERLKDFAAVKASSSLPVPEARRAAFRAILDEAEGVYVMTTPKLTQEESDQLFLTAQATIARLNGAGF